MTTLVLGREPTTVEALVSAARSHGLDVTGVSSDADAITHLDSGQITTFVIGGGVEQQSRTPLKQHANASGVAVSEEPLAGRDVDSYVRQVLVPQVGTDAEPVQLFDVAAGFGPIRNLVAAADPDVQWIGDRWWMFFGAANVVAEGSSFAVNLFTASLPSGAPLSSPDWTITTTADQPHRAQPLVELPEQGRWDEWLHTPSYVYGPSARSVTGERGIETMRERIYYTGSSGAEAGAEGRPYSIGVMERAGNTWVRRGEPVLRGTTATPCVFEPKVRFLEGKWRMWYLAAPKQAGPGELPEYRIEYVDSDDGLEWGPARETFPVTDNYFDAAVTPRHNGYDMIVARGPNLFATPGFPSQGLWWLGARLPSSERTAWTTDPVRILDADQGQPWYTAGVFGPCARYGDTEYDRDTLYVFFAGAANPVPRPYVFSIGRLAISQPGE
ncbi:MAG: hypothetical protein GEV09_17320 [Pseudonocardiaceae bacterium]|nr:hypothetical protein [Pseudonocardiaceae bacterium]